MEYLKSAVESKLNSDTVVILDSLNKIANFSMSLLPFLILEEHIIASCG